MIVMIILLVLVVIACGLYIIERLSIKGIFRGISYDIKPSRKMVEIDEEFTLVTTIINTKSLPITSLQTAEFMPEDISFSEEKFETDMYDRGRAFVSDTYLLPRRRMIRRVKVSLPRRGRYFFHGAVLTSGSFLGFFKDEKNFYFSHEVVLPPKPFKSFTMEKMLGNYLGDVSVTRFILEDPVLTVGFREYSGREPMRSISWKQTARTGEIMVKNYDHTLDLTVTVILNVHTSTGNYKESLETLYSMTRTVCEHLEVAKTPYRFVTNLVTNDGANWKSVIPDGLGGDHFAVILEVLARATYNHFDRFEEMVAKVARSAEQGRSHILLTPDVSPSVNPFLHKLRARTGREVLILTPEMDETEM
jgi:uncharacterized protein (DUF58 family)